MQNKANLHFTAKNAEFARLGEALRRSQAEKKDICVSDCSIKKYALCPISPRSLRTRRLIKNKAKQSQTKPMSKRWLLPVDLV